MYLFVYVIYYNDPSAWAWVRYYQLLTVKWQNVRDCYTGSRNWRAFVNTVMNIRVQ
jgi:hypothetical protein